MIRKFLHLLFSLASATAFAGYAFAAAQQDELLEPRAAAFVAKPVRMGEAAIGIIGLRAPAGQDFIEYGRAVIRNLPLKWADAIKKQADPKSLDVIWNPNRMDCWTYDDPPSDSKSDCAPIEEAIKTLQDNVELRERYRRVQKLSAGSGIWLGGGTLFISLAKLTAIEIKIDLRQGRYEDAYRKWADHHTFLQRMGSAGNNWVGTAICLVNEGFSLGVAESLLFHAPQLINAHYEELTKLLQPSPISRYDFEGIERSEYEIVQFAIKSADNRDSLMPNYIANRYFHFSQEMIEATNLPASELQFASKLPCKCISELKIKPGDERFVPSSEFLSEALDRRPIELVKSMHSKNRQMNLLTMKLKLVKERIPDRGIEKYVAAHTKGLREPFSNAPIQWNPLKRELFYKFPKEQSAMGVRF